MQREFCMSISVVNINGIHISMKAIFFSKTYLQISNCCLRLGIEEWGTGYIMRVMEFVPYLVGSNGYTDVYICQYFFNVYSKYTLL